MTPDERAAKTEIKNRKSDNLLHYLFLSAMKYSELSKNILKQLRRKKNKQTADDWKTVAEPVF